MSLQIHHDTDSGSITLRWRIYEGDTHRDALIGFVGDHSKFRAAHPALDRIDGATWGPNLQLQIADTMKMEGV